ncbi:hypothetical protein QQZ08_004013 [Neonectria magnoliae]|uniref:Xylanolytic transcriptional activator regulatory domain-containing protein n=1 Tax=Neonectria magnoliae TaxID=2732573 RepID=A0ABR1I9A9_9HYPO
MSPTMSMTTPNASPRGSVTVSEPDGGKDEVASQPFVGRRGPQRRTKSTAYLDDLLAENKRLRNRDETSQARYDSTSKDVSVASKGPADGSSTIQAPSLESHPWFFNMNIPHTPILIGEASDAAFATRFRQAISDARHNHLPRINYPTDERLLALSDIDCQFPFPSRARLLVNVALKYVTRCYHIVRKSQILEGLEQTIQNPHSSDSLLKSKLWALFAIGEMYSTRTAAVESNFPGMGYFARATRVLRIISERPRIDAVEIRLLLSFYSLALNRRYTAYALAGSAVRLSVVMGLHLNVPESQLSDPSVREHRNRVWWTAYSFDRMWASRLGHPVAIQDEFIEVDLPCDPVLTSGHDDFKDSGYLVASVRLARLAGRIGYSIYNRNPQQTSLSQRVQEALKDLRNWVEELPAHLHIEPKDNSVEPSPKPLSLHLYFNQGLHSHSIKCVISATRPILLHVLRTHVATWDTQPNAEPQVPASAMTLAEACVRCARHSCRLLIECWIDGSFATFDYFYTQYLFSAATVLAISSLLDWKDCRSDREQFESSVQFLEQLKETGNFAAGEFCQHTDAMKVTMAAAQARRGDFSMPGTTPTLIDSSALGALDVGHAFAGATAGMALSEPSLQELLSQPVLDLQFINASMYQDGSQGLYWPDISPESWPSDPWVPG